MIAHPEFTASRTEPRKTKPAPETALGGRPASLPEEGLCLAADSGAHAASEPTLLRLSAGFVYFYFGFLKLFPDLSPAELIATETLSRMSLHWLDAATLLRAVAVMEIGIGLSFLLNIALHRVFFVFLLHQFGTFMPLFLLPEMAFKVAPFAPTMEGQYILKNLVSLAAGWTVLWPAVQRAQKDREARRREVGR